MWKGRENLVEGGRQRGAEKPLSNYPWMETKHTIKLIFVLALKPIIKIPIKGQFFERKGFVVLLIGFWEKNEVI